MPRTRVPNARSTFFMVLFCLSPCKNHFWVLWMWDVFFFFFTNAAHYGYMPSTSSYLIPYNLCWIKIVLLAYYDCCCAVNTEIKLTILRLSHKRLLQAWLFYIQNHLLILPFNFPCNRTMFQGPMHAV